MKILVTGGAGFIGTNLIKRLLKEGHQVVSIDNYSTGLKQNEQLGATYIEKDLKFLDEYNNSYWEKFDIVYHLAAKARIQPSFINPIEYFETNATVTMKIAEICSKSKIPLVYAGSSSHHSGKFQNPYTFSKDIGEDILEMFYECFDLRYSITRFYNVYGPYQLLEGGYTTLIGKWINNINKSLPCEIYGDGEQTRDFTHVDDIIDALILIIEKEAYGNKFELGRGENISINKVAKMFKINPIYKNSKPGEARDTLCKNKTAHKILNWTPKKNLIDFIKHLEE